MPSKRTARRSKKRAPTPDPSSAGWLVYKCAGNGGLVFQALEEALYDEAVNGALAEAKTWGEFRRLLPPGEWEKVLSLLEDSFDDDAPANERWDLDRTPFSAQSIRGFSDGDYPRWAQQTMDEVLPDDLLVAYGKQVSSVHNGMFWQIPHEHAELLVAALRDRGYQVEEASFLRGW